MHPVDELAVAARCRNLVLNVGQLFDKGLECLFRPLIAEVERSRFWRLLDQERVRKWPPQFISRLASVAAGLLGLDEAEVLAHLIDGAMTNTVVLGLMRSRLFRETSYNLSKLSRSLEDRLSNAKSVIAVQRVLPLGYVTCDEVVEKYTRHQQRTAGFNDDLYAAKLAFATDCRQRWLDHYDPGKTKSEIAFVNSGFEDLVNCRGCYEHCSPEEAFECVEGLRWDIVGDRQISIPFIDDQPGRLPQHLADWIKGASGVLVVDDRFVMRLGLGTHMRTFFERTGNPQNDAVLDREIARVRELLGQPACNRSLAETKRKLEAYGIDIARAAESEKQSSLRAQRLTNPAAEQVERPVHRVDLRSK